jgi:hypothetical protein
VRKHGRNQCGYQSQQNNSPDNACYSLTLKNRAIDYPFAFKLFHSQTLLTFPGVNLWSYKLCSLLPYCIGRWHRSPSGRNLRA